MPSNLIGIVGIVVLLAIAYAFSSNRKAIHLRVVGATAGCRVDEHQRVVALGEQEEATDGHEGSESHENEQRLGSRHGVRFG